jgi:hypothetical protein
MKSAQTRLAEAITEGYLSEDFCNAILTLINNPSKGGLMQIAYNEDERRKVDSAYPQDYANAIRDLCPTWNGFFHVYDYNQASFGSMQNVAEKAIQQLWKLAEN